MRDNLEEEEACGRRSCTEGERQRTRGREGENEGEEEEMGASWSGVPHANFF
jgi:hypothetical protein